MMVVDENYHHAKQAEGQALEQSLRARFVHVLGNESGNRKMDDFIALRDVNIKSDGRTPPQPV